MKTSIKTIGAERLAEWGAAERGRYATLAKHLGVTAPVVSDWCSGKKRIPSEQCPLIESLTGIVSEELRPDVRWDVIRGRSTPVAQDV